MDVIKAREIECQKICIERFIYAILLSASSQFILLTIFLLFVNFNIFHPITWITGSISHVFSWYTWICITPLISAVLVHGILLAKFFLTQPKYYSNRFSMIVNTFGRKALLMIVQIVVGFFTSWVYIKFLRTDYSTMFVSCNNGNSNCFNEKYLFIVLNGAFAGFYYFVKERIKIQQTVVFPVIQQSKYLQIRSCMYSILYNSSIMSFLPTLGFFASYYFFGGIFRSKIESLSGIEITVESSLNSIYYLVKDFRLFTYVWILTAQILSSMYLLENFFIVFLTEYKEFPIEKKPHMEQSKEEIILADALATSKIPIIQQLACLDLFVLSNSSDTTRRKQIFSLSIPGGHPYNWKSISEQFTTLMSSYCGELSKSVEGLPIAQNNNTNNYPMKIVKPSATEMAEKVLFRQYNESFGIRNMSLAAEVTTSAIPQTQQKRFDPQDAFYLIASRLKIIKQKFLNAPGIYFLFGEPPYEKICFLLSNSQEIVWITQGIAALIAHSIREDNYGVVQNDLPAIIKSLLKLKYVLDKISNANLGGRKVDRNYIALKNAIKRSIYRICTCFADYLNELLLDENDLRILQCYINYKEP